jgi:predicted nucleic acid-binding protein
LNKAVADTSIFIAQETGRELGDLPEKIAERSRGRRLRRHDTWIAATAMRHGASILTQDSDFSSFAEVKVLRV